jgi:signal transduction histidine kinase/ActR/RegA family two-component response regulator
MRGGLPDNPRWREKAAACTGAAPLHVFGCLVMGLIAARLVGGTWPMALMGANALMQLAAIAITKPLRRRSEEPSGGRNLLFYSTVGLSSVVTAAAGGLLWIYCGEAGRFCAVCALAASAITAAVQARGSIRQLWIAQAPILLMLVGLPLVSFLQTHGPEREATGLVAFCAFLFALHQALTNHRGVVGARAIADAVADARRAQARAEAADRAKSDFLAVMSHELRTPLNGVLGMAQIMEGDELAGRQRQRLEVLKASGEALLVLVNDLLDVSRIDDSTLELEAGEVDLAELAAETQAVFAPLAQAKNLGFSLNLEESAGLVRLGDAPRVRQVLHKLVGNAVKFTESGQVQVVIGGTRGELIFQVTDSGPGIEPERQEIIFERFSLPEGWTNRRHGGTGLGLAITRGLARLMGGDITVRSELGAGAVFTARLAVPILEAAAPAAKTPASAEIAPAAETPEAEDGEALRLRILAAEDNYTNQLVLKTLLEQLGVTVHLVENGEEAVAAWRAAEWDLVLMDIQMPQMDGITATRIIRNLEVTEGRARTPIIAVTANATPVQAAQYVDAGMDGLVPKPIHLGQLLAAIAGVMSADNENLQGARSVA